LKGNVHPLAQRQFDRGAAPASAPTGRLRLLLQRSQEQQRALTQYLADLQNPAVPSYRKWLSPGEYAARFGASESDLVQVETWLQSHGFKIEKVPQARNEIEFSGTVDQVQSAFHTAIHTFVVNGETHVANISDPEIPAALAPVVSAVGPLHDFRPKPMVVRGPQGRFDPSTARIEPDLTLQTGSNNFYLFVGPADAAIIYNTPDKVLNPSYTGTTYDGAGISIGIAGVSDLTTDDVANYRKAYLGESSGAVNLPTVVVDGNAPGLNGAGVEALLDTEVAGGIAPKASLYFYTSADGDLSSGLLNAIYRALDDNRVSILSISFGNCESAMGESGNHVILEAMEQAAAQGITVTVSSGDNGSAGCDDFDTQSQAKQGFAVNAFASTPYSIAVGGTDFDVLSDSFATYVQNTSSGAPPYYATALKYIPENPWNDSTTTNTTYSNNVPTKNSQSVGNIVAGSGGASSVYSKPAFQSSLTPQDGTRDLPDVSLLAGDGFYHAMWAICSDSQTDGASASYVDCQTAGGQFTSDTVFGGVGGTSASAPAFAGMLALVAQAHGSSADNHRLGQAADILYQLAKSRYSTVFHDVTTGNNSVACSSGSPNCGANGFLNGYNAGNKYDLASGLGSVDAAAMVNNWTSVSIGPTSTSLKIDGSTAAYTGIHGAPLKFDVSVSPGSATGVAGIVDNANANSGGTANNGQIAVPLSGGTGSATYNGLPGGSYKVWARYGGDTSDASSVSTPPINVTIGPEESTTTLTAHAYDRKTGQPISATSVPLGAYVVLDAQIEGAAEGANTQGIATGTVTFTDGNPVLAVQALSTGNEASWPTLTGFIPVLTGGDHDLTATYSGDASFKPSSATVPVNVVPGPSRVSVDTQDVPSLTLNASQSGFVYATVYTDNFNTPPPTGTDSLILKNTVVSSADIGGGDGGSVWMIDGGIPIRGIQLQPGLNTFTVQYSGDGNYGPSSAGPVTIDAFPLGDGPTLTIPGTVSMTAGNSFTTAMTITPSGGYTGNLQWSCDVPSNDNLFQCSVPPTHVPLSGPVDTLLLTYVSSSAPAGDYTVRLKGNDGTTDGIAIVQNITVKVTAAAPTLAVIKNGLLNVAAGSATGSASAFSVIPSGGLTGQVNLTCSVTTSITDPQSAPTCTVPDSIALKDTSPVMAQVQVGTTASTSAGDYSVTITATSASNSAVSTTATVPLAVTASPSFSISTTGIVNIPVSTNSPDAATLTINPFNGFNRSVKVTCSVQGAFAGGIGDLPTCAVPSSVKLSSGIPSTVNVGIKSPSENFAGAYLVTLSVVDRYSAELGYDASIYVVTSAPPSFSLSNNGNITVSAGATSGNAATMTLSPVNGFTGNVNLSCKVSTSIANPKDLPGCSLSPAQVSVTGSAAVTSKLTVTTTAPTSATLAPQATPFRMGAAIPLLALAFLFGISSKRKRWMRLLGALALVLWLGAAGCGGGGGGTGGGGGGGGDTGTTTGSYSVTVTAADVDTGKITDHTVVTVTVN
jgi:hypothetical protein